ncbi:TIGR02391 family protein [Salmonella enterica subsp. diarizonae]|nr:TIGR02391 family protein [Salmonella enterica]EAA5439797.1 TIGR02391 family protein [Salmonella enterica subsp. diarizonae]EED8460740.1 TIGR02391 family protein [Salmonella enterica subsp. diarizonae serovar 61:i:z53]AXD07583.1 TIGR02391 family protein [Salmonella enterica]EAA7841969.1 TIGR02391 family protein [Salmonella enterica]EAT1905727.1 TIGR02391 family protein [Salmonella enterica]
MIQNFRMTFDPKTIEHLGVKMYSTLPPALAELISNAYDADAENVTLEFLEVGSKKFISVKDNGMGMDSDDIQNRFLVIGRNRRKDDGDKPTPKFSRFATGKKGLGKLALFGLAREISIDTIKNGLRNRFVLNWDDLLNARGEYKPIVEINNKKTKKTDGTTIKLSELKRQTPFDVESLADSLSKIFIVDDSFNISLKKQNGEIIKIDNDRRYSGFNQQFVWDVNEILSEESEYNGKIYGKLYTSETPIRPNSGLRGISLFSRGKLVNNPEFFSNSTSSHFFQYLTGWFSVDFIDELDDDVISTNRQSVDWDNAEMAKLRDFLSTLISKVNNEWRNKRKEKKDDEVKKITGIDTKHWMSTMPKNMREQTSKIIDFLGKEDALESYSPVIHALHDIIPEYPMLHWRHLNEKVKDRIQQYYINKQYGLAADQGTKIYCEIIRDLTGCDLDGRKLTDKIFPGNSPAIRIGDLSTDTGKSMQEGQHFLSTGVMASFRNPASHMPADKLVPEQFSELDCLNILGLISYLLERLDGAEITRVDADKKK